MLNPEESVVVNCVGARKGPEMSPFENIHVYCSC